MNLYDYVHWRGDISFEYDPINEMDVAIFTMISYIDWAGIVGKTEKAQDYISLQQAAAAFDERRLKQGDKYTPNSSYDKNALPLLALIAHTTRFRSIELAYFEEKIDFENSQQFAALTFFLSTDEASDATPRFVVTYRGTDNTWVGWKEDFETFYKEKIPAQGSAETYLKRVLSMEPGPYMLAGHSKGGHLAVYAATTIKESDQNRVHKIYSFDGLGFNFDILDKKNFMPIEDKILHFLPQDTIVGNFFPLFGKTIVVDSEGKMFDQHNPFLWLLSPKGFVKGSFSEFSIMNEGIIQSSVGEMSLKDRRILLNGLFDMLGASQGALKPDDTKETIGLWKELKQKKPDLDPQTQEVLDVEFDSLKKIIKRYIGQSLRSKLPWHRKKKIKSSKVQK